MELSREKLENYQKNLRGLQEVTDELLSHMKGRDWSFRKSITDKKGKLSQEKLQALVTELLDVWSAKVRGSTDADPNTKKSLAEPWLQERQELYGLYLYLVMRCSLEKGGYCNARNGAELEERTDFAFLLEQARHLSREWCIVTGPNGTRRNELYWGYDAHFGFHLYYALHDPDVRYGSICTGNDYSLTPDWRQVCAHNDDLTNDGNMKRIYLQHLSRAWSRQAEAREEEAETEEELPEVDSGSETDGEDSCMEDPDDEIFIVPEDDEDYSELWELAGEGFDWSAEYERREEEANRGYRLSLLAIGFECSQEYCSACERFVEIFQNARPEVLRDFYRDLEEIVDLYLAVREIAPLTDTGKTLNVYSRIYDGPLQHAKRYGRGVQWETM